MEKIKYYCDICSKEVVQKNQLTTIDLPTTEETIFKTIITAECCNECLEKIRNLLATKLSIYCTKPSSWKEENK